LIAGQLEPKRGTREIHQAARPAFFAQHAAEILDGKLTVLEAVEEVATDDARPRLRSLLGSFLFVGDDVFKHCRILSGGERQRVAIARLLLQPTNLLLLDEPTHHLDLSGKEVLEEALSQYPGAVVVVTHDRSLMARLATRILAVRDGRVELYPGGYDDYEAARLAESEGRIPERAAAQADGRPAAKKQKADQGPERKDEKRRAADSKRRSQEIEKLEREIEAKESELKALEVELANPAVYAEPARSRELLARYESLKSDLEATWGRLEALSEARS
jgi:ATP-binding cassette subfamily F protein 3